MNFIPADESVRNVVRTELNISLAIEAGAGTGKTTLLIDRLIALLTLHEIQEIVAITFTEKAAGELLERLRSALEAPGHPGLPLANSPRRRLEALRDFDKAHISTIHSFASRLIHRHAFELELDPDFVHLDGIDQNDMLREHLIERFTEPNRSRDEMLFKYLSAGGSFSKLVDLCLELVEQFDIIGKAPVRFHESHLDLDIDSISPQVKNLFAFVDANCLNQSDNGFVKLLKIKASFRILDSESRKLAALRALSSVTPGAGLQKNWRDDSKKVLKERLTELKEASQSALADYYASVLQKCLNLLFEVITCFKQDLRRKGLMTFQDQLYYAAKLLGNSAVAKEISGRFKAILIDEFQDTDPLQAELALAIALPENRRSETSLTIVGDLRQSIYRFRRADTRLFRKVSSDVGGIGRRLAISQNFRSTEGIVNFVNAFFQSHWNQGEEEGYTPLIPLTSRISPPPTPSVQFLEAEEDITELNVHKIRRMEAEAVADTILRAVEESWQVLVKEGVNYHLRPISYGDMVVLMPSRTGVDTYTDEFAKKEIPFSVESSKGFFASQFSRDLLNVIRAVDNPADRLAVVAACRSTMLGVSDPEIDKWGVSSNSKFDIFADSIELPDQLSVALGLLKAWYNLKFNSSPIEILNRISDDCMINLTLVGDPRREAERDYWEAINSCAYEASFAGESLRHLRRKLDRMMSGELESGSSPVSEKGNKVSFLTIHSAKGLEFPMVILANMGSPGNKKPKVLADHDNPAIEASITILDEDHLRTKGYRAAENVEKTELEAERLRLLYVAMTRACDHLIISRIHTIKKNPYYDWFQEFLDRNVDKADVLFQKSIWRKGSYIAPKSAVEISRMNIDQVSERTVMLSKQRADATLLVNRETHRTIRPAEFGQHQFASVQSQFDPIIRSGVSEGRAFHRYMESAPLGTDIDNDLLAQICRDEGIEMQNIIDSISYLHTTEVWMQILRTELVRREVPVTTLLPQGLVKGVIDLVWEVEGGYAIADYKTGSKNLEPHSRQVDLYAMALEKSTNRPVVERWLLYVSEQEAVKL